MERINDPDAVNGRFDDGDPVSGRLPTPVTVKWLNDVQEEIINVIEGIGISLDATKQDQLFRSISRLKPFDFLLGSADSIRTIIENATNGRTIYVKPGVYEFNSPINCTADEVKIELAPGALLSVDGLQDDEGILQISGERCTVIGGQWAASGSDTYHAVKYTGSNQRARPYFGFSRVQSGLLFNTTFPPSSISPL